MKSQQSLTNTWDWILLLNLSFCVFVIVYIAYYASKLHEEPVIIMDEQGITIYRFGFIPWHDISALSIVEKPEHTLIIKLKNTDKLQPVTLFAKLFMHARWDESIHTITINIRNLKVGQRKLIYIYEQLMQIVPTLRDIEHAGLYEYYAVNIEKTVFPIYISRAHSWSLVLLGVICLVVLINIIVKMPYLSHKELWNELFLIIILVIFLIWLSGLLPKILWQQEPELIFNEQGIIIHHLGFVPWQDIQRIRVVEGGGRHRKHYLLLDLAHDSSWQPIQQQRGAISTFSNRKKIITIDCNYLKVSRSDLIDIYETLMMVVPRLHDIDHRELYSN